MKKKKKNSRADFVPKMAPTTEDALTRDLDEDLVQAWIKIKAYSLSLGEQRVYASGKAIMFSKKTCFFFVRPKKSYLEIVVFLSTAKLRRSFKSVRSVSRAKFAHAFKLVHEDQVEGELTDAIREAYLR